MHIPTDAIASEYDSRRSDEPKLRVFVFTLFFIFGGITSLNDIIIPKLRDLFALDHASSMLVQSAFFLAYALFSVPAAAIVRRIGYMRTASVGLATMTAGCLAFIPASSVASFPLFLAALFVLGAGITVVQVVANPLISSLGSPTLAAQRLTFAQAFNSLGTTLFPLAGSAIILSTMAVGNPASLKGPALDAFRTENSRVVVLTYISLAIALLIISAIVWSQRNRLNEEQDRSSSMLRAFTLLKQPRFACGTASIFLYVGAEVAIGSLIVNYLMQDNVLALSAQSAGNLVPFYWGGSLIGRFIGAYVLKRVRPGKVLACVALVAIALIALSASTYGALSGWSLLGIGLMNSVMFPTIFSLASEGLGNRMADGSGVIATAIVGGAVIPYLTGGLADASGSLAIALTLPAACYVCIAGYGILFGWKTQKTLKSDCMSVAIEHLQTALSILDAEGESSAAARLDHVVNEIKNIGCPVPASGGSGLR